MAGKLGRLRLPALASVVLCIVALVLSFLCLFAGSKKGFMEDYAIVTLNTSRIGENVVQKVESELCDLKVRRGLFGSATSVLGGAAKTVESAANGVITEPPTATKEHHGIISSLESVAKSKYTSVASVVESAAHAVESDATHLCDEIADDFGDKLEDVLQRIGLSDWYSAHIMDFCEGSYIPGPVPNSTVKPGTIHKNVTACSNKTAMYTFDPKETIAQQIYNATNGDIDLTNLHWPKDITNGLNALKDAQKAVFVFYCMAIACIFLALVLAIVGIFYTGRLSALSNVLIEGLAFLTIVLASAIVTVIAVKATHLINKYGKDVDISATRGNKFLALTWAATGLVFLSGCVWTFEFFAGWRRDRRAVPPPKYG